MSKISLEGNASGSGTLTIAAPNTNSNFTLSLPTNTGTIITQNSTPAFASTIGVGGATAAASGAGITFPATQSASSNANTLDDYEEGVFTPALQFGGASAGLTYFEQVGLYTKIGNLVTATGKIYIDSAGSSTGDATITGLPFTSSNASGTSRRFAVAMAAYAGNQLMLGALSVNSTTISLVQNVTGAFTAVTNAGFQQFTEVQFTVSYQV